MHTHRIATLDGFRALAILPVVLFHFFSRWTPPLSDVDLYPYENDYGGIALFRHGYLGVQFFFVISGFVIAMTLASSKDPLEFLVRRASRLWPAMLLCSMLTFLTLRYVAAAPFATQPLNFVPSLLFAEPFLISRLIGHEVNWMDGAYWSVSVEVRFYFWAALIYFLARPKFLEIFVGWASVVLLASFVADGRFPMLKNVLELVCFTVYLPWFIIGIGFFSLYTQKRGAFAHVAIIGNLGVLALHAWLVPSTTASPHPSTGVQLAAGAVIVAAFYAFVYKPRWLSILNWRPLTTIGASSYSLYLLHQFAGLTLLRQFTPLQGVRGEIVAAAVIVALIGLSILLFRYWETPSKHLLLRLMMPIDREAGIRATAVRAAQIAHSAR